MPAAENCHNDPATSFLTTQWTRVLESRGNSTRAGHALRDLCAAYYEPVTAFLRRSPRDHPAGAPGNGGANRTDHALDAAHGFFEWLLSRDPFAAADRQRGRFRSYLLGALKHYLSHERQKQHSRKRGGGIPHLSLTGNPEDPDQPAGLELPDPDALPPDREFDRQWALHVLRRALQSLEKEFTLTGESARFILLKPFLTGEATHGGLATLAAAEGWPDATARSHLHRLRQRFRQCVKREISPTLATNGETDDELTILMAALRGS